MRLYTSTTVPNSNHGEISVFGLFNFNPIIPEQEGGGLHGPPFCVLPGFLLISICWSELTIARLITYFGNFVFGFFVTLVAWFSVQCFPFPRQNQVTKMGWKQHMLSAFCSQIYLPILLEDFISTKTFNIDQTYICSHYLYV